MALSRLANLLITGSIVSAAVISVFSVFGLNSNVKQQIFDNQKNTSAMLLSIADTKIKSVLDNKQEQFSKAADIFSQVRNHARELSNKAADPLYSPTSFFGFDYFTKGDDNFQVFYSPDSYPDGINCMDLVGVPKATHADFTEYLKSIHLHADRYKCLTGNDKNYIGYLMESASGKNVTYLYLERFDDSRKIKVKSSSELLKELATGDFITNGSLKNAVWYDGELVYATEGLDLSNFDKLLLSKNGLIHEELKTADANYLSSIRCDDKVCVLVAEPDAALPKANLILSILAVVFGLLLAFGIYIYRKQNDQTSVQKDASLVKNIKALTEFIQSDVTDERSMSLSLGKADVGVAELKVALNEAGHAYLEKRSEQKNSYEDQIADEKARADDAIKRAHGEAIVSEHMALQKTLMPVAEDMPSSRFLDIASFLLPSKTGCTDGYDIFRIDKDNLAFIMASVTKKGRATLRLLPEVLVLIRKMIRDERKTPEAAFSEINRLLIDRNHTGAYVNMLCLVLSEYTGNFSLSLAGFDTPILAKMSGANPMDFVKNRSLGEDPEEVFTVSKGKLDFGNSMLISSSGLKILKNSEDQAFGVERVALAFGSQYESTSKDMLVKIFQDMHTFAPQEPSEDLCVICIKKTNNAKRQL